MTEDQLKAKYQPAFQEMDRQQVPVAETRMEGGKLYVLAWAPTQEVKNQIWDAIKRVDPNYADLTMDIRVGEADPHSEFERAVGGAGASGLAQGLASAFRSHETPPFSQMVSHLFGNSNGEQKAGLLNSLFSTTPSSLSGEVLGMLRGGGQQHITPEQAENVPPEAVQKLAEHAEQHDSSVVEKVSQFYSQHPGVVKTLGVGALTFLTSRIVGGMRGRGA